MQYISNTPLSYFDIFLFSAWVLKNTIHNHKAYQVFIFCVYHNEGGNTNHIKDNRRVFLLFQIQTTINISKRNKTYVIWIISKLTNTQVQHACCKYAHKSPASRQVATKQLCAVFASKLIYIVITHVKCDICITLVLLLWS